MVSFWVHTCSTDTKPMNGNGVAASLGPWAQSGVSGNNTSDKVTVWADKEAVLSFCKRKFKKDPMRDLGDRVEVDLPAYGKLLPARTLAWTLVQLDEQPRKV